MVRVNKETGLPSGQELCHSKTLESDLISYLYNRDKPIIYGGRED